ncbi:hypothetical protein QBC35DRAFT_456193 [Podospora australis]|uniref:Uncharacterized protein n=1 Tax=Podospora australis TaxID=1536484 RepID=A0AAN6WLK6_9PEZI|nr:hypothetical protein QBC35DRAFT_456193 [Podospora australis]
MLFKTLFLSLSTLALTAQATPIAALEAKAAVENRQGSCITGSCLTCVQWCIDTYMGPDRATSLQRTGCTMGCLSFCNGCD